MIAVIVIIIVVVFFYLTRNEVDETNSNSNLNASPDQAMDTCQHDDECVGTCTCGCIHINASCPEDWMVNCVAVPDCFCQEGKCQELSGDTLVIDKNWTIDDCLKYNSPKASAYCLTQLSLLKMDEEICSHTVSDVVGYKGNNYLDLVRNRTDCINQVAQQRNDIVLCQLFEEDLITDISNNLASEDKHTFNANTQNILESSQNTCYWNIAANLNDAGICNSLENIVSKDGCYSNLSSATKDIKYCQEISTTKVKDDCIYFRAKAEQNKNYCENISTSEIKEDCYEFFGD